MKGHRLEILLCCAIVLPGRKSGFRSGFRPDFDRGSFKIGSPTSPRPAGGPILRLPRLESGRNPVWKPDLMPGKVIAQHRVAVCPAQAQNQPPKPGTSTENTIGERRVIDLRYSYVAQECFRAGNRVSGLDVGRILIGDASKSDFRPAFGGPMLRLPR